MPKIKLRGSQFLLISSALMDRYEKERLVYHKMLCDALGEDFELPQEKDIHQGVFLEKKQEAIGKHSQLAKIGVAKLNLFEAEHRGEALTSSEAEEFEYLQQAIRNQKNIIYELEGQAALLNNLKRMAVSFESRADDVDIIEKYDDEPKLPPLEYELEPDDFFPEGGNWGD